MELYLVPFLPAELKWMEDDLLDDDSYDDDDDVTRSNLPIPDIFQTECGHNETADDKYPTYPLKASSNITNCYESERLQFI